MMKIMNITDPRTGQVSAMKAGSLTPMQLEVYRAGAAAAGLTITFTTR